MMSLKQKYEALLVRLQSIGNDLKLADFETILAGWRANQDVLVSVLLLSLLISILSLAFPLVLLQIYDRIIPNQSMNTLVLLSLGVLGVLLLELILKLCRSYVGAWADAKFEHTMGCDALDHLINSQLTSYEETGAGEHLKRMGALASLKDFYAGQALISLVDIPFIFVILLLVAYIAGWLVLIPILVLATFMIATALHLGELKVTLENRQEHENHRMNFIIETLNNIHTVKSVTMEEQMLRRYEQLQKLSAVNDHTLSMKNSYNSTNALIMSQVMVVLIVVFGSASVIQGALTIGTLAATTLLSSRCLQPVSALVSVWNRLQSIKIAQDDLKKVFSLPLEENSGTLKENLQGSIEFKNVSFRYSEKSPLVLDRFSIQIHPRETVAITGSGLSGKTSLFWLLLRLFSPNEGEILLDGKKITEYELNHLREQIAYMPQQSVIFTGTIMENLTLFETDRYYDAALELAEKTGLSEIIEHLPNGYNTRVGEQAIETLPQGIKQRIAIIRSLIRRPPIVLFDEANVAIDMHGDAILKKMLTELATQCTLIIVSHRPSILEIAKKVYQLEQGALKLAS